MGLFLCQGGDEPPCLSPFPSAALVYRLPLSRRGSKLPWKLLHAALALVAFLLAVLGLVAVFSYHKARTIANMYSLHSWVGLTAVVLFSCQVGATTCECPFPTQPPPQLPLALPPAALALV